MTNDIVNQINSLLLYDKPIPEAWKATLKEDADSKCTSCDGYGIFYGNVCVCHCVEVEE
jgi:hypothetical protein